MASDAHAHPGDLARSFPQAEGERRRYGAACAASAWNRKDFEYHEGLARSAREDGAAPVALCFAVHPQLPAAAAETAAAGGRPPGSSGDTPRFSPGESLALLETLAAEKRLHAVGETGFDLYDFRYRSTEALQEELFIRHLEVSLRYGLPLVLHVRRAMSKIFAYTGMLRRLPAVVFHSYSGTPEEGEALLRRGINAYFSFGAVITLNHKTAMRACAVLPLERLLTETDAPYQPPRGAAYSRWRDIPLTLRAMAALRQARQGGGSAGPDSAAALEAAIDRNWRRVFFDISG